MSGLFSNLAVELRTGLTNLRAQLSNSAGPAAMWTEEIVAAIETELLPKLEQSLEARALPSMAAVAMWVNPQLSEAAAIAEATTILANGAKLLATAANAAPVTPVAGAKS